MKFIYYSLYMMKMICYDMVKKRSKQLNDTLFLLYNYLVDKNTKNMMKQTKKAYIVK